MSLFGNFEPSDIESATSLVPRTLYHILSLPDAAISFKWLVQLPRLPEADEEANGGEETKSDGWMGKLENVANTIKKTVNKVDSLVGPTPIMMRAKSLSLPHEQIRSTTVHTQARMRSFPESVACANLSITFYEDYSFSVLNYLKKWQKVIVNENGVFGVPYGEKGYAKDILVHLFDTCGLRKGTATLENCYPEEITGYELGSDNGVIETTCSFSVHRIKWEPSVVNWGSAVSTAKAGIQNITSRFTG